MPADKKSSAIEVRKSSILKRFVDFEVLAEEGFVYDAPRFTD